MVSIHAPARGATYLDRLPIHHHGVSIHAPRGVRQSALGAYEKVYQFQFTHPRGVRPGRNPAAIKVIMFQFTHPRGVRLRHQSRWSHRCRVSIHAPARGATRGASGTAAQDRVSIHAPARGATRSYSFLGCWRSSFNSRTREGCDFAKQKRVIGLSSFQFTHPRGVRPALSQSMARS